MAEGRSGWVTFSWIIFMLAGLANVMYGAAALVRKEYFPEGGVVFEALQSHGWVWLIIGIVQLIAAFAIMGRKEFGRLAGLTLAVFGAIVWFYYMLYIPVNGLVFVTLYTLVIYGLASTGDEFS